VGVVIEQEALMHWFWVDLMMVVEQVETVGELKAFRMNQCSHRKPTYYPCMLAVGSVIALAVPMGGERHTELLDATHDADHRQVPPMIRF
jgi:hypothetical protein